MIKKLILITVLIAFSQCTLIIVSPKELASKIGEIPYSLANYGNIPYGHTFIGTIAISDPVDGCGDISEKEFDDESSSNDESTNFSGQHSPVYLIERGNCSFVQKSRHAEEANGKVTIIYNHKQNESVNDIILMDQADHSGKGLMVSTIFVSKITGETIKDYIEKNPKQEIVIKILFKRPAGAVKNKIKFWMSSMDLISYEFLTNFYKHYQDLKLENVDLLFVPHYITQQDKDEDKQKEHCISKGKYCTPEYKVGGYDMHSREVILEDLRQLIIFQIDQNLWWRYVLEFKKECVERQVKDVSDCSDRVLMFVAASPQQIKTLKNNFQSSFSTVNGKIDFGTSENTIMELERQKQSSQSISILPTLIFNGEYFRGDVTQDSAIYEFVCSSFVDAPESCFDSYKEWIDFKNKIIHKDPSSSSDSKFGIILLVIIGIFVLMLLILFLYRRMIKKEMSDSIGVQVNSAISNYFALNDTQNSKSQK